MSRQAFDRDLSGWAPQEYYRLSVHWLYFAEREVKLFLKDRSRIIQMTDLDDGILKITKSRDLRIWEEVGF